MKADTLFQAMAQAATTQAQDQIRAMERVQPKQDEKHTTRMIHMLPRAAEVCSDRIREQWSKG